MRGRCAVTVAPIVIPLSGVLRLEPALNFIDATLRSLIDDLRSGKRDAPHFDTRCPVLPSQWGKRGMNIKIKQQKWWIRRDLNPRPRDYESPALTD